MQVSAAGCQDGRRRAAAQARRALPQAAGNSFRFLTTPFRVLTTPFESLRLLPNSDDPFRFHPMPPRPVRASCSDASVRPAATVPRPARHVQLGYVSSQWHAVCSYSTRTLHSSRPAQPIPHDSAPSTAPPFHSAPSTAPFPQRPFHSAPCPQRPFHSDPFHSVRPAHPFPRCLQPSLIRAMPSASRVRYCSPLSTAKASPWASAASAPPSPSARRVSRQVSDLPDLP